MCKHDELILQKLEQLETVAAETRKIAENSIQHLREEVATHTAFTKEKLIDMAKLSRMEFDNLKEDLQDIKKESAVIKAGVQLTNGRVTILETTHAACPVKDIARDFGDYKAKMKPVYLVATSWKMIVGIAILFSVIMTVGKFILAWAADLAGIHLPQ